MLAASTTRSSAVPSVSVASVVPTAIATEDAVPDSASPVSATETASVSASFATLSRCTVNAAAAPSVTGLVPAAIVAIGSVYARVTVAVYARVVSPSAAVTVAVSVLEP